MRLLEPAGLSIALGNCTLKFGGDEAQMSSPRRRRCGDGQFIFCRVSERAYFAAILIVPAMQIRLTDAEEAALADHPHGGLWVCARHCLGHIS